MDGYASDVRAVLPRPGIDASAAMQGGLTAGQRFSMLIWFTDWHLSGEPSTTFRV